MRYETAVKVIEKEAEFLGKTFDWVMENCDEQPGIFKLSTLDAYEVIREELDPDPGAFADREAFR